MNYFVPDCCGNTRQRTSAISLFRHLARSFERPRDKLRECPAVDKGSPNWATRHSQRSGSSHIGLRRHAASDFRNGVRNLLFCCGVALGRFDISYRLGTDGDGSLVRLGSEITSFNNIPAAAASHLGAHNIIHILCAKAPFLPYQFCSFCAV